MLYMCLCRWTHAFGVRLNLVSGSTRAHDLLEDARGAWCEYFTECQLWLPVAALDHVDVRYHDVNGKVVHAPSYECPVCHMHYTSFDALRTHLGVLELSAIYHNGPPLSRRKKSPHCILDMGAFAARVGISDREVVDVLRHSEKFPLDMFLDLRAYQRAHPNWKRTLRKILLGALGEKMAADHARRLIQFVYPRDYAPGKTFSVKWHHPLQGTTRDGVSNAVDVMIFSKGEAGAFSFCSVLESKIQDRVNKAAWYKSFITNVSGTILTTGRIDAYRALHVREMSYATVRDALINGYIGHPMYAGHHHEGDDTWHVVKLAGGRRMHVCGQLKGLHECLVRVRLEHARDASASEPDGWVYDGQFRLHDDPLPVEHGQLLDRVNAIIAMLDDESILTKKENDKTDSHLDKTVITSGISKSRARRDRLDREVIVLAHEFFKAGRAISAGDVQVALGISLNSAQGVLKHLLASGKLLALCGKFSELQRVAKESSISTYIPTVRTNTQVKYVTVPDLDGTAVDIAALSRSMAGFLPALLSEVERDTGVDLLARWLGLVTFHSFLASRRRWSIESYINKKVKSAVVRYLAWNLVQCLRYNHVHLELWNRMPSFFSWKEKEGE